MERQVKRNYNSILLFEPNMNEVKNRNLKITRKNWEKASLSRLTFELPLIGVVEIYLEEIWK